MNCYLEDMIIDNEQKIELQNTEFLNCIFVGLNLSGESFKGSKFIECSFKGCNLSNVNVLATSWIDVKFSESNLIGINWCNCNSIRELRFIKSKLDYNIFQDLNFSYTCFSDCSLLEANFTHSNLMESSFVNCDLKGALFNECNLSKANFKGAKNYWIDPMFNKLKGAYFNMPDALALIEALGVKVE